MSNSEVTEKKPQSGPATVGMGQFLTFSLGGELYAMSIESIREIIEYTTITTVPLMPPFLRGVINLRGSVVPVIDLMERFGRGKTSVSKRTCVVIVEIEQDDQKTSLGIMVDAVVAVLDVDRSHLGARPSFGTDLRADFIEGILDVGGKFMVLLDTRQVLSINELSSLIASKSQMRASMEAESA